jgi:hypothetical protein
VMTFDLVRSSEDDPRELRSSSDSVPTDVSSRCRTESMPPSTRMIASICSRSTSGYGLGSWDRGRRFRCGMTSLTSTW